MADLGRRPVRLLLGGRPHGEPMDDPAPEHAPARWRWRWRHVAEALVALAAIAWLIFG